MGSHGMVMVPRIRPSWDHPPSKHHQPGVFVPTQPPRYSKGTDDGWVQAQARYGGESFKTTQGCWNRDLQGLEKYKGHGLNHLGISQTTLMYGIFIYMSQKNTQM